MKFMNQIYRYIGLAAAVSAALVSCRNEDILGSAEFNIVLDSSNSYLAGEPVKFKIEGEVDNLLFYSGETGAQYKYRDRYSVPAEDIKKAELNLTVLPQYGSTGGGLSIYITDKFDGLSGTDAEADRAKMKALFVKDNDGNEIVPEGWTRLDWEEKSGKNAPVSADISALADNFSIAFHWNPKSDPAAEIQRTYSVLKDAAVTVDLEGSPESKTALSDFGFTTLMMSGDVENAYKINGGNGTFVLTNAAYLFRGQGIGAGKLDYNIDGWYVTTPRKLNTVENDKGTVIKNTQNYLDSYEYTFAEPGSYTVTFVGTNENYLGSKQCVRQFTVNILAKI